MATGQCSEPPSRGSPLRQLSVTRCK